MNISTEQVDIILSAHNSLWEALYDTELDYHSLHYQGKHYDIYVPQDKGYASAILPNPKWIPFLWITQNLNQSTYGSYEIIEARKRKNDLRFTWIVDTRNGQFTYRTNIKTCTDKDNNLLDGQIEIYDSLGTEMIWNSNKSLLSRKAAF